MGKKLFFVGFLLLVCSAWARADALNSQDLNAANQLAQNATNAVMPNAAPELGDYSKTAIDWLLGGGGGILNWASELIGRFIGVSPGSIFMLLFGIFGLIAIWFFTKTSANWGTRLLFGLGILFVIFIVIGLIPLFFKYVWPAISHG